MSCPSSSSMSLSSGEQVRNISSQGRTLFSLYTFFFFDSQSLSSWISSGHWNPCTAKVGTSSFNHFHFTTLELDLWETKSRCYTTKHHYPTGQPTPATSWPCMSPASLPTRHTLWRLLRPRSKPIPSQPCQDFSCGKWLSILGEMSHCT